MWTTLSFRDRHTGLAIALVALLSNAAVWGASPLEGEGSEARIAPDAPRAARAQPKEPPRLVVENARGTIELKSLVVRQLRENYFDLAGPAFLKEAKAPWYIEVQTQAPLRNLSRSAAPVIILNGERLMSTRPIAADRLLAFIPDQSKLKESNTVTAVWLGATEHRDEKKPLTFRRDQIDK